MDLKSKTVVLTAECLCKTHTFSTEVSTSKLPLEGGNVCHCDSCRHSTGALYVIETTWPQPREAVDLSGLARYQFSANITYRFCGTCSTLLFYESRRFPGKLGTYSGPLRNVDADVVRLARHIWVEDTRDGGASVWLRRPNRDGEEIARHRLREGELAWDWPRRTPRPPGLEGGRERDALPAWCHCRGVELRVGRGDYAGRARDELPWFVDPRTNKLLASFDACDSCRLQFGNEIVHWTFVELANIARADGGAFPNTTAELKKAVDAGDPAVGTLTYYQSSPDVQRYFCKICSASAFYACDDRPEIVDVAVGLLEAPEGARAESFLSWSLGDDPAWVDDTKGGWREGLMKRVQADAEEFRIAKGYPKSWRRLEKEAKESNEQASNAQDPSENLVDGRKAPQGSS
ncbi:putative duf636 domain-containing protein [Neofusicoccum parvum UCRNP2]|uniref:Putative duf636 domain-containing protein n=1 Tax=Botryosphaeria parva (strain UCR-NP2) TaxID=1287680 RepID=R1GBL3_BOTPV|nr:putative duf636 domain-containing protein [Neofusicoccum parvum UCRNP2]